MALERKDKVSTQDVIFPRVVVIAPDGPQGAELKLAIGSQEQQDTLHNIFYRIKEEGKDLSIGNIRPLVEEAGLIRTDT